MQLTKSVAEFESLCDSAKASSMVRHAAVATYNEDQSGAKLHALDIIDEGFSAIHYCESPEAGGLLPNGSEDDLPEDGDLWLAIV